jgi:hypothetical protein
VRVADFARELGLAPADLMGMLDDLGITVMSDASMLQPGQVRTVRAHLAARASAPLHAQPAAIEVEASEPGVLANASQPGAPDSAPHRPSFDSAPEFTHDFEWNAARTSEKKPILLWGPPGSGKSTFLAGMMFRQTEDELDPFDWRIIPVGVRAGDYIRSVLRAYRSGAQPNATVITDAPFRFKIRKVRRRRQLWGLVPRPEQIQLEADLLFIDPPGELFTVSRMRGRTGVRVLELMENAAGMLLLIDPTFDVPDAIDTRLTEPADAELQLRRSTSRQRRYWTMLVENLCEIVDYMRSRPPDVQAALLDDENRLRIPTAICITKMDQHQAHAHRPAEFLREQIGEAAFALIENSFSNYAVYACSALGNDAELTADGVRLPGNPRPWGVVDPIRWILEESMHRRRVLARFGWGT